MINVSTATIAKDGDHSSTQRLLQSSFNKERIVGTPFHAADSVQVQGKVAENSHGLLCFVADHDEPDLRINRPGGSNEIRMAGGHPCLHATVASDRTAIERDRFILCPGACFNNGWLCVGESGADRIDRAADQLVDVVRSHLRLRFVSDSQIQLLHVVGSSV